MIKDKPLYNKQKNTASQKRNQRYKENPNENFRTEKYSNNKTFNGWAPKQNEKERKITKKRD